MGDISGIFIPFVAIVAIFGVVPLIIFFLVREFIRSRHKARMAEIERGYNPEEPGVEPINLENEKIKKALMYVGIGLGLICGYILDRNFRMNTLISYGSMLFLFIGASRLVYYLILKKHD
jgi:cytochrome b subunit of formate dehydrogenase